VAERWPLWNLLWEDRRNIGESDLRDREPMIEVFQIAGSNDFLAVTNMLMVVN
jgi:hypothetical protein